MSTTPLVNEATERLRNRIRQDHGDHDNCKFLDDLDVALATERRNTVERGYEVAEAAEDEEAQRTLQADIAFECKVRRNTVQRIRARLETSRRWNASEAVYFMDEDIEAILDEVAS